MIGMLKVANNGNDLLQILDAITDTKEEVISSDAVDFSGQPVNFWVIRFTHSVLRTNNERGAKIPPFLLKYIKIMLFLY